MKKKYGNTTPIFSEINVTPFVDVLLVLLIVFMVCAPMMTKGISVNLPQVVAQKIPEPKEPVEVFISKDLTVHLQAPPKTHHKNMTLKALKKWFEQHPDRTVILKADAQVVYLTIAKVLSTLKQAHVHQIALAMDPPPTPKTTKHRPSS